MVALIDELRPSAAIYLSFEVLAFSPRERAA